VNNQNEVCASDGVDEIHSWPFSATEGTQFQSSLKGRELNWRRHTAKFPLAGRKQPFDQEGLWSDSGQERKNQYNRDSDRAVLNRIPTEINGDHKGARCNY
jgi:hypothetical protein